MRKLNVEANLWPTMPLYESPPMLYRGVAIVEGNRLHTPRVVVFGGMGATTRARCVVGLAD
jgi:hypothetical protein